MGTNLEYTFRLVPSPNRAHRSKGVCTSVHLGLPRDSRNNRESVKALNVSFRTPEWSLTAAYDEVAIPAFCFGKPIVFLVQGLSALLVVCVFRCVSIVSKLLVVAVAFAGHLRLTIKTVLLPMSSCFSSRVTPTGCLITNLVVASFNVHFCTTSSIGSTGGVTTAGAICIST